VKDQRRYWVEVRYRSSSETMDGAIVVWHVVGEEELGGGDVKIAVESR